MTGNPGGIGHTFLKSRYIDPAPIYQVWTPKATKTEPNPRSRCFIQAFLSDNPKLDENDPGYRAFLESLPDVERMALLEGRWDIFAGQYFTEWSPSAHICQPEEVIPNYDPSKSIAEQIPSWWTKLGSLDWGFGHPFVAYWGFVMPDGRIVLYREMWVRGVHVSGDDGLIARMREYPDTPEEFAAGPDVFGLQSTTKGGPTISKEFTEGITLSDGRKIKGIRLKNVMLGKQRRHGWQQTRRYLQWRDKEGNEMPGRPLLRIIEGTCPKLEACLPTMLFSDTDPEDMKKVDIDPNTGMGGDDPADSLRHFVMQRPWIGQEPEKPKFEQGSPKAYRAADQARNEAMRRSRA
jgi:hypothetical protein